MSKSLIKVFFTDEEQQPLSNDDCRYYIGVQTKIPTVIVSGGNGLDSENGADEFCGTIPPRLDHANQPYYSHPNVAAYQLCFVIFDITDHPQVPAEHTTEAADQFLADHFTELDHALRRHLK